MAHCPGPPSGQLPPSLPPSAYRSIQTDTQMQVHTHTPAPCLCACRARCSAAVNAAASVHAPSLCAPQRPILPLKHTYLTTTTPSIRHIQHMCSCRLLLVFIMPFSCLCVFTTSLFFLFLGYPQPAGHRQSPLVAPCAQPEPVPSPISQPATHSVHRSRGTLVPRNPPASPCSECLWCSTSTATRTQPSSSSSPCCCCCCLRR